MKTKIKDFFKRNEAKIALGLGLILVAVISFEAGFLKGQNWQAKPLVIEKPGEKCISQADGPLSARNSTSQEQKQVVAASAIVSPETTNCAFMGSKNSNKYHLPSCQWAKRIKPENIVCFKSAEDAVSRGYQPDKGCIK